MSKILFENKKVALGFAGAIILGAAVFSGMSGASGDAEQSRLASVEGLKTGPQIAADQEAAKAKKDDGEKKEEVTFATDEELIDQTSGFEPTPREEDESGQDDNEDRRDRNDRDDDFDEDDPYAFDEEDPYGFEGF